MFLCVVDGRQTKSLGMNFHEMAEFLLSIGAWNAVNLDGGGSTTMVISSRIINSPSDITGERPVANTLQVIRLNPLPVRR
jgi:exopolysaccharide biosynthesis protein